MSSKAELSKKYLELKKKIEQKEKKLQKVNRVLKAQEHVKKKIKELNGQSSSHNEDNLQSEKVKSDVVENDTQNSKQNLEENLSSIPKTESIVIDRIDSSCYEVQAKYDSVEIKNGSNSNLEPDPNSLSEEKEKKSQSQNHTRVTGPQQEVKTNLFADDTCISYSETSSPLHVKSSVPGQLVNRGSNQSDNANENHRGDSEESAIVIGDSQPVSSANSVTDGSQNSNKSSKKRLSLKGKRGKAKLHNECTSTKVDTKLGANNQLNTVSVDHSLKDDSKKVKFQNETLSFEDTDSMSLLQPNQKVDTSKNISIGNQVVNEECTKHFVDQNKTDKVSSSKLNDTCLFDEMLPQEASKKPKLIETKFKEGKSLDEHSYENISDTSQETVICSTPENIPTRRRGRPPKLKYGQVNKIKLIQSEKESSSQKIEKSVSLSKHLAKEELSYLNTESHHQEKPKVIEVGCTDSDNMAFSISSQDSIISTQSDASESIGVKRKRGRPKKNRRRGRIDEIRKQHDLEVALVLGKQKVDNKARMNHNTGSTSSTTIAESQDLGSQNVTDISGSQELFDNNEKEDMNKNRKSLKNSPNIHKNDTEVSSQNSSKHESPEISTMKLLQESFVERKEYSTRRRSSTGSPFMISSVFQFIIDEARRKKEVKDFDLPDEKFAKEVNDITQDKGLIDKNFTSVQIDVESRKSEEFDKPIIRTNDVNNDIDHELSNQVCCIDEKKNENQKDSTNDTKTDSPTKSTIFQRQREIILSEFSCPTQETMSENSSIPFQMPRLNESQFSQDAEDVDVYTSSQSLFSPENKTLKHVIELSESQTDSMDTQNYKDDDFGDGRSFELPDVDELVSLCSCSYIYRKKLLPVLGCLTNKSLLLWRYKDGFSFIHRWDLLDNYAGKEVSTFTFEGRAFFIVMTTKEDNSTAVFMASFCNKRESCMFKISDFPCQRVESCHISDRVIALGYTAGETIHVDKYILHHGLKSLTGDYQLETTPGQLRDITAIENLPASIAVWTEEKEFCIWNHENKKLLLRIKLDCVSWETHLLGTTWEQGFMAMEMFSKEQDKDTAGLLVLLNPATEKSFVSCLYRSTDLWTGYKDHCSTENITAVLDHNHTIHVWDRHSLDLLSSTQIDHADHVTFIDGHVTTGGEHCVHLH